MACNAMQYVSDLKPGIVDIQQREGVAMFAVVLVPQRVALT
jgi:hypothetical protein